MTVRAHLLFWAAACAVFLGFVFVFKSVLLPFVLGFAIAYLLNPAVDGLRRYGIARGPAAMILLAGFVVLAGTVLAALMPLLYKELTTLSREFPGYVQQALALLKPVSGKIGPYFGIDGDINLEAIVKSHAGAALNVTTQLVQGVVSGGQAALNLVSVLVFMPIVAYFMMKEWDAMTQWVKDLMPRHYKDTILDLFRQIDKKLSGFVRGQLTVAFILGLAYALALSLVGLKYGFLIGLGAGALSIIPMVGSVVGLIVSVMVAWFQAGEWVFVLIVAAIFLTGQFIEGNFLTPKLVGSSVGLHPLWVFFALLAGGSLFGILGMILAVPVAAVIGVLLAFGIKNYKASPYYKAGKSGSAVKKQRAGKKKTSRS